MTSDVIANNFMEKEKQQELQTLLDGMKYDMGAIELALQGLVKKMNDIGELLSDKPKDEF